MPLNHSLRIHLARLANKVPTGSPAPAITYVELGLILALVVIGALIVLSLFI